jgi:hypothetical protein
MGLTLEAPGQPPQCLVEPLSWEVTYVAGEADEFVIIFTSQQSLIQSH